MTMTTNTDETKTAIAAAIEPAIRLREAARVGMKNAEAMLKRAQNHLGWADSEIKWIHQEHERAITGRPFDGRYDNEQPWGAAVEHRAKALAAIGPCDIAESNALMRSLSDPNHPTVVATAELRNITAQVRPYDRVLAELLDSVVDANESVFAYVRARVPPATPEEAPCAAE